MAKWTLTFEDVIMPDGETGVSFTPQYNGADDIIIDANGRWTPATACVMTLVWAWNFTYLQRLVLKYEQAALEHFIESSAKSNQG